MKQSRIDTKDKKEAQELKKIYYQYLDKRTDNMEKTQFKNEDGFAEILGKDTISLDQILRSKSFSEQTDECNAFKTKYRSN